MLKSLTSGGFPQSITLIVPGSRNNRRATPSGASSAAASSTFKTTDSQSTLCVPGAGSRTWSYFCASPKDSDPAAGHPGRLEPAAPSLGVAPRKPKKVLKGVDGENDKHTEERGEKTVEGSGTKV